jgi:hypothetical protein
LLINFKIFILIIPYFPNEKAQNRYEQVKRQSLNCLYDQKKSKEAMQSILEQIKSENELDATSN